MGKREAWRVDGPFGGMLATAGGLVFRGNDSGSSPMPRTTAENSGRRRTCTRASSPARSASRSTACSTSLSSRAARPATTTRRLFAVARVPPRRDRAIAAGAAFTPPPLNPPPSVASAEEIARGRELYDASCVLCHDDPGNAGGLFRRGLFPDSGVLARARGSEAFNAIVLDGARAANGMASFSDVLDADGAEAIRAYLIADANAALPTNAAR